MIDLSVGLKVIPSDTTGTKKAYGYAQMSRTMDINEFAEHISSHGCVYGRADIAAILTMAVDCMRENLLNGVRIKLGDLGSFGVSLHCTGADSIADFRTDVNIVGVSVLWTPGTRFSNLLDDATFNVVPSRKAARKLMQAIKAGEETVDLSESDTESGTDNESGTDSDAEA